MNLSISWYRPSERLQRGQFWLTSDFYVYVTITQTFDGWIWEAEAYGGKPIASSANPLVTRKKAEDDLTTWAMRYRETQMPYISKEGNE